ncbi:MAG TPA: hypothetical protein VHA11_14025 [Bryobacteraceae bacterium]|nr:hypothetical protein [Bryobacteraceae bacterium]
MLAAKLMAAGGILYLLWSCATWLLPAPRLYGNQFFGFDLLWTFVAGFFFLAGCGLVYLAFLDQRYRCRVCARRLRMPIVTGSWGRMLQLGRPGIEYICPFGHGTLKVEQLQILGPEGPDWKRHEDMWTELLAAERDHE